MNRRLLSMAVGSACALIVTTADAKSPYDGAWNLLFVTRTGACDATYSFSVRINNGVVTHPNLVRFKGYVASSGTARASVTVMDKRASGSGRLSGNIGRGNWSGYSAAGRCRGYWTASKAG